MGLPSATLEVTHCAAPVCSGVYVSLTNMHTRHTAILSDYNTLQEIHITKKYLAQIPVAPPDNNNNNNNA